MESHSLELGKILERLDGLRQEFDRLNQRVAALEAISASAAAAPAPQRATAAKATPPASVLSEELILTISAAVAAYLGVKPTIRHIRVLGSTTWGQQGRATIQASHSLLVHRS